MGADSIHPEEVLERAKRQTHDCEVFHVSRWSEPVVFEANRLKSLERRESSGMALRLIKDGRIGFSSSTRGDDPEGLIRSALETAPFGPQAVIELPDYRSFVPVKIYDSAVESHPLEDMVQLGQTLIDKIRGEEPELLCDASVSRDVTTLTLLNSRGGYAKYTKTTFSASVGGTLINDTDMMFLWEGQSSCQPLTDPDPLVGPVLTQLERGRAIAPPVAGEVPAVFTPWGVSSAILPPLIAGFNGKSILQGSSPLVGKLGHSLLDDRISLWDEPHLDFVPGSRMCDDEGIPTRRMPLVDHGVISNFLYDLQTAGQSGTQSTGNCHRGLNSLPSPGVSVTVLSGGEVPFQDMIGSMDRGIVVERLLGAGQSNILGGDFNANVLLGYSVENGKIIGRLKNTVISGNVYTVLKKLQALGDDVRWVGGSLKTPSILCASVSVATQD